MKIGLVTMVKDEVDVIYHHLCYYYNIGIRDFYIIDNNSTDGTWQELQRFKSDIKGRQCFIHIESDTEVAYWQYRKINKLARRAYDMGCTHILPVDADELLFYEGHHPYLFDYNLVNCSGILDFNIYRYLERRSSDWDVLKFEWWYYRPIPNQIISGNPFLEITRRDYVQQSSHKKIIVAWKPEMEICQGNHGLHWEEKYKVSYDSSLFHAHFKTRSREQIEKKTINLGKAYEAIVDEFYHETSIENYREYQARGKDFIGQLYLQDIWHHTTSYAPFREKDFILD